MFKPNIAFPRIFTGEQQKTSWRQSRSRIAVTILRALALTDIARQCAAPAFQSSSRSVQIPARLVNRVRCSILSLLRKHKQQPKHSCVLVGACVSELLTFWFKLGPVVVSGLEPTTSYCGYLLAPTLLGPGSISRIFVVFNLRSFFSYFLQQSSLANNSKHVSGSIPNRVR